MPTIWYALFIVRTSNMVRTFLSDRNSVSGSRSKKPDKQQIELHKRHLFPYLQAFLEALFMSSAWALSPSSIKHCYRHSRSRCPFISAQIGSKFLLLSFRMPSIFTRFLSRAEPPRETQTFQLSRFDRDTHGLGCHLTFSRFCL